VKGMDERTIEIIKTYSRKTGHTSPDTSQKNWEFLIAPLEASLNIL
jgi:hypothetical protein